MIAHIQGRVVELEKDQIVLEVGGVGLQVYVPTPLITRVRPGENISLFTQLVVREESLTIYGFETKEYRQFFNLLMGVNGIGPRSALSILSTLEPGTIRRAVIHEQAEIFTRVPGIGMKTGQKILLHLQDRIKAVPGMEPLAAMSETDSEVLAALTSLGYSVIEAQSALQSIPAGTPPDVETRLRLALQYFSKP